ncbi:hypothetical protein M9H77_05912 [Catharanthus roseus]|uniref:Uncharacterized protein n=1 Tax=Catharanthus roseus TaxID=4058 RepID=A0ACC0BQN4_CATRO|nr:hypothetical protein M9H77_05912 [Catharanthus roseus]
MEERRRILGKSPDIPIPVPRPLPFGSPSNAFHMPSSGSVFNIVISPETKMVNLNVPSIMEVGAGFSPPHNKFSRSAPSTTIQQIPTLDQVLAREITDGCNVRRLRRTISNRLSAQRSRMKKAQYIIEMEQKIKDLQFKLKRTSVKFKGLENFISSN